MQVMKHASEGILGTEPQDRCHQKSKTVSPIKKRIDVLKYITFLSSTDILLIIMSN